MSAIGEGVDVDVDDQPVADATSATVVGVGDGVGEGVDLESVEPGPGSLGVLLLLAAQVGAFALDAGLDDPVGDRITLDQRLVHPRRLVDPPADLGLAALLLQLVDIRT